MPAERQDDSKNDALQNRLDGHARSIEKKLLQCRGSLKPQVVLSHFLIVPTQQRQQRQFLRRSSIAFCRGACVDLPQPTPHRRPNDLHKEVHAQFISYLDRDNTFLDYIVRKLDSEHGYEEPVLLVFQFGGAAASLPGERLSADGFFSVDADLCEQVCPKESAERFMKELYERQQCSSHSVDWNDFFFMRRVLASKSLAMSVASESEGPVTETDAIERWQTQLAELAGIQSAISYMGTLSTYRTPQREFSIVVGVQGLPGVASAREQAHAKAYGVTMLAFNSKVDPAIHDRELKQLRKILSDFRQELPESSASAPAIDDSAQLYFMNRLRVGDLTLGAYERDVDPAGRSREEDDADAAGRSRQDDDADPLRDLKKRIADPHVAHSFVTNVQTHSIRCLILLQKIIGEIHEQQRLDFYFVCGERSVFSDKAILRKFNEGERRLFDDLRTLTSNYPGIRRRLLKAAEFIAREHYPWFEDGRYALFWDCSSQDERPFGLVKLRGGNWHQIAQTRNYQSSGVSSPECILLYSMGRQNASGMLHLKPQAEEVGALDARESNRARTVITPLLSWSRDRWIFPSNSIELKLENYLHEKFPANKDEAWVRQLSQIVARIALDEQKGGTIVVAEGSCDDTPFREMGRSLDIAPLGYDAEDLVDRLKLISHDGASVVSIHAAMLSEWRHRRYLFPGSDERRALGKLFDKLRDQHAGNGGPPPEDNLQISATHHPLRWKGTRRWAAAAAAFNENVKLSIVISQDGDIQVWHVQRDQQPVERKIHVFEITRTGETQLYWLPYGSPEGRAPAKKMPRKAPQVVSHTLSRVR